MPDEADVKAFADFKDDVKPVEPKEEEVDEP